jgi:hypothetical protein
MQPLGVAGGERLGDRAAGVVGGQVGLAETQAVA